MKLALLFALLFAILMPVGSLNAQDCTPWGCGCPGPEEFWEGKCQIMPVEPGPLQNVFIPWIEGGLVDATEGIEGFVVR